MYLVGLTGGIATGKSTVSRQLATLYNLPIIDCDILGHCATAAGSPLLPALRQALPPACFNPDGSMDRRQVGALVFADPARRRALERSVHPWIAFQIIRRLLFSWVALEPILVLDAVLLVEQRWYRICDATVVVYVDEATQLARLRERQPTWTEAECRQRMAAQMPSAAKLRYATQVIDNSGAWADTAGRLDRAVPKWHSRTAWVRTVLGWPFAAVAWAAVECYGWLRYRRSPFPPQALVRGSV